MTFNPSCLLNPSEEAGYSVHQFAHFNFLFT